ncbi:MAG: AMP-binding protein, partial [Planctomycetales bacterium]|nr:AMP-binding protein [Planctomycetales bacterium]
ASGQFAPATHEAIEIPAIWQQAAKQDAEPTVLDDTIAAAFVKQCLASKDRAAVGDLMSGVLSYRRLLVGAMAMKRRFEQLDGEAVGLLLPASVAADTSFFALQMAGKLPVLLNWTTGPTALRHAVDKLGIKKVITSHKFVDRMGIEVEGAEFVFLEDLRKSIGKVELFGLLAKTYLAGSSILHALPRPSVDDVAVVLFTSGSESLPKAVPLTHGNLISNIKGGLPSMKFRTSDALLGFLPPFHSFGLTGNMLLAILSGIRVVHHPDPTDAAGLTRIIAAFRPSLLFSTPTFLSYILNADKENAVSSLRIVVTGAEKCPASLVERSRDAMPDATILEGYGITECSPVVSINQPERQKHGTIGLPLSNVQTCVVHADSLQPVGSNETGLLLVAGPSIFHGYLHYDGPSPFVEVDGQAWYNTGDLVAIDNDGFIHFKGRMKRFIKSGGEMISLPALEEPFLNHFPPTEDGPQIAVEGIETPGGRLIALFTTVQIELKRANEILTAAGFRGIMRIDEVRSIDSIPVLGTGKTDYKQLRSALQETTLDSSLA